jgi:hypothetical protein
VYRLSSFWKEEQSGILDFLRFGGEPAKKPFLSSFPKTFSETAAQPIDSSVRALSVSGFPERLDFGSSSQTPTLCPRTMSGTSIENYWRIACPNPIVTAQSTLLFVNLKEQRRI